MSKFNRGDRVEHVRTGKQGVIVEQLGKWVDWRPDGYRADDLSAAIRTDISNLRTIGHDQ